LINHRATIIKIMVARRIELAAATTTLIMTVKRHDVDPLAWLTSVLACIADVQLCRLPELLPWRWKALGQKPPPDHHRAGRSMASAPAALAHLALTHHVTEKGYRFLKSGTAGIGS
jgi:hypothetical protein